MHNEGFHNEEIQGIQGLHYEGLYLDYTYSHFIPYICSIKV